MDNNQHLNVEIMRMRKAGLLPLEQSRIEWVKAYLPADQIDNGRGGTYEIIQYPLPPKPCYDNDMLLIPYDKL